MDRMSSIDWLEVLESIACDVRTHLNRVSRNPDAYIVVGTNSSGDLTRKIDLEAEKTILEGLQRLQIPLYYIGEEISTTMGDEPKTSIVADCLDGTLNAVSGIPFFCTSIAVSNTPRMSGVFAGLVMDLCRGDVFVATKNGGASLNGKPIRVSEITELSDSILRVSFSHLKDAAGRKLLALISRAHHDRHLGSAALELCYLAAGFYQGFVDIQKKLRPTDLAAAHLIIKESGGIISSPDGHELDCVLDSKSRLSIVASCSNKLHQEILDSL
jgi:myo-inositol-1(or 4)-monophosphatase